MSVKSREKCVLRVLKQRQWQYRAFFNATASGDVLPQEPFSLGTANELCRVQMEACLCAPCRLPATAGYPWSPTSRKCQGYACLTSPVGPSLTQKQVAGSWPTISQQYFSVPAQETSYKGLQNNYREKKSLSSLTLGERAQEINNRHL